MLDGSLKDKGKNKLALCLVGKIMTTKLVNKWVFFDVMSMIWRVNGGVETEALEGNIFALHFKTAEDRQRILMGRPWYFDRAIVIFEEPTGTGDIRSMRFASARFWIQIHNVPLICMSEEIGFFLGKMIGEVREVDVETGKGETRFLRVRTIIAAEEPLKRSLRVDILGSGEVTTMLL